MKRTALVFSLFICLAFFATGAFAAPQYELRLAITPSPPHPWVDAANFLAEEVAKKTEGKIKITVYNSSSLGTSQAVLDDISMGTIDLGMEAMMILSSLVPESVLFSYPYFFKDYDQFNKVVGRDSPVLAEFKNIFTERKLGIKLMALGGGGTRNYSNRVKPINVPEDLKGMKMRVPGSPVESKIWGRAGALTTPTSWGEVYSAMQTGVVDAFESTISGYYGSKLYEVASYHSKTQHQYMVSGVFMSELSYNKLPEEFRSILVQVCHDVGDFITVKGLEYDDRLLKEMVDKNLAKVNEVDKDAFMKLYAPLQDELAEAAGYVKLLELMRSARDN